MSNVTFFKSYRVKNAEIVCFEILEFKVLETLFIVKGHLPYTTVILGILLSYQLYDIYKYSNIVKKILVISNFLFCLKSLIEFREQFEMG